MQCAEFLSKQSPLKQAQQDGGGADSAHEAVQHSLSVLVLEGRDRIGGRIHSVSMQHAHDRVVVDHGAVSKSHKQNMSRVRSACRRCSADSC